MMRLVVLLFLIFSTSVFAHKSSDSYFSLNVVEDHVSLRWDIAIRDLQNAIDLDFDGDGEIQWSEVKYLEKDIFSYSLSRLNIASDESECDFDQKNIKVNNRSDGFYIVLYAEGNCGKNIDQLDVNYQLFFDIDTQHRGLMKIKSLENEISFSFSPEAMKKTFALSNSYTVDTFFRFLGEGVWHIWIGYDHVLFLLCLLLPAVLLRNENTWLGARNFTQSFKDVVVIVTAFTVAHSLTLMLVMIGGISLPVMLVESVIAFSVFVAALNNLYPVLFKRRWLMGFGFGLIHGFGFANVLTELDFGSDALFATILGFNIGVELGQLAIVAVFLPVAYLIRNGWFYRNVIFKLGSMSMASFGLIWFLERAL